MGIVGTSSSDTTALVNPLLGAYGVTQFSFGETQLRLSGPAYKAHVRAGPYVHFGARAGGATSYRNLTKTWPANP